MSSVQHAAVILVLSMMAAVGGCGAVILDPPEKEITEVEPNDDFAQAQVLTTQPVASGLIEGTLSDSGDVDVYDIGAIEAGQKINIYWKTETCDLSESVTIALFDEDDEIARLARGTGCSLNASRVFSQYLFKTGRYYLAVAYTDQIGRDPVDYTLRFTIDKAAFIPKHQTVYLNFHGDQDVYVAGLSIAMLAPFSDVFGDLRAEELADWIVDSVRADYQGLDVDILSSYEQQTPSGDFTTVHVAGTRSDNDYYGLADSIDWYNEEPDDNAIVFGAAFDYPSWSDAEIAQAVANVVSHEMGHLLGLIHTEDNAELMDRITPSYLLIEDQEFGRAPLSDFPIGWQDALELLQYILGV